MLDRFLGNWSIKVRILSIYLAVGLGLVGLVFGALATLNTLLELIKNISNETTAVQVMEALPSRLNLFMPIAMILFALGLVWSLFISNSIDRQLREFRKGVDQLRNGVSNVSFSEVGSDELGNLAQSLNQLSVAQTKEHLEHEKQIRETQRFLNLREAQLRLVGELARTNASIRNLEILLNRTVQIIKSSLEVYFVGIYLVDEERRYVHLMAGAGGTVGIQKRERALRLGEVSIITGVIQSGVPRLLSDVRSDFIYRIDYLLPDTRSEIALPLRVGREVMGVLDIHSDRIGAFTQDDLSVLQILADQLALSVQNVRLIQNLQRSIREANSIYQRYTQRVWSRDAMSNRPRGFQYDSLQIMPVDHRLPKEVVKRLSDGNPLTIPSHEIGSSAVGEGGNVLLVPIMMYNQLVGVIGLERDDPNYQWSEEEISLATAVTNQVSLTLDNVRLLEETQLRSTQIRLLHEITSVASSHTNLIELLDHLSQKLRVSFDLLHCGMFLLEPDSSSLTLVASASSDPFLPGANLMGFKIAVRDHPALERAFTERTSQVIYENPHEPDSSSVADYMLLRRVNSIAIIPLQTMNEVIGVAALEINAATRQFGKEDLRLFDQISLQISSAIDVARSFEHETLRAERERKVSEVTARMRESLDIDAVMQTAVREIQRAFELAQVEIYIDPAKIVGEKG